MISTIDSKSQFSKNFDEAMDQFNDGDYENSAKSFSQIAPIQSMSVFSEEQKTAFYYSAYSQLKLKNYKDASFMLNRLTNFYTSWRGSETALYLKAITSLESGDYAIGIIQLRKCQSSEFETKKNDAKEYYLSKITSLDTLKMLYQKFPAESIVKKLYMKSVSQNGIAPKISIAYTLPLNTGFKTSAGIQEFYIGFKLAVDSFQNMGYNIDFQIFESGDDSVSMKNCLSKINNVDLLVGPTFSTQLKTTYQWQKKSKINIIVPLAAKNTSIYTGDQMFYINSSIQTQAKVAAKYALNNFRTKKCIIIAQSNPKDSILAKFYKTEYEKMGGKTIAIKYFKPSQFSQVKSFISTINLDSIGHIFVSSNNSVITANLFSVLESKLLNKSASYKDAVYESKNRKISAQDVAVFSTEGILTNYSISYSQLTLHNTHLFAPNLYDNQLDEIKDLKMKYIRNQNMYPTFRYFQGFYTGLSYLESIFLNPAPISKNCIDDATDFYQPFFCESVENQNITVLKFQNYQLKKVN